MGNKVIREVTGANLRRGKGFLGVGDKGFFLDPGKFEIEEYKEMQKKNIKIHGKGPFLIKKMRQEGFYVFVLFVNDHGEEVWKHFDCFDTVSH